LQSVASNTLVAFEAILPKRAGLLVVQGTAGQLFDARLITDYTKF